MCPHVAGCAMFQNFKMEASLRLWQVSYCEREADGYSTCERFKMTAEGLSPSPLLLPNGKLIKLKVAK